MDVEVCGGANAECGDTASSHIGIRNCHVGIREHSLSPFGSGSLGVERTCDCGAKMPGADSLILDNFASKIHFRYTTRCYLDTIYHENSVNSDCSAGWWPIPAGPLPKPCGVYGGLIWVAVTSDDQPLFLCRGCGWSCRRFDDGDLIVTDWS